MKKILYIAFAAAMLAAVSCAKELELKVNNDSDAQGLTLTFSCGDMATRGEAEATTVDGVSNENLIKKIDYFFFPVNEEGTVDDDTEYVYNDTFTPEDDGLAETYTITFTPGVLSKIFPNGAKEAMIFAVANYVDKFGTAVESPITTIPADVKTWGDMHSLRVGETFFKDGGSGFGLRWPRIMQPNDGDLFFVMTGEQKITLLTAGSYAIDAEVPLKRLASKVTAKFTYEEVDDSKGIHWVPQSEAKETRVFLSNAIEHSTLGGPLTGSSLVGDSWTTATKPLGDGTRDIFEYAYDFMNSDITTTDDSGNKVAHYYTYPIQMESGDDNQSYLKLVLPWYGYKYFGTVAEGENLPDFDIDDPLWKLYKGKEVYYKIVLPSATINEGNRIYEYDVTVNIIGADKEVMVTGEKYKILDWSSGDVPSNVATGKYISLDIPKLEYDMYSSLLEVLTVSSGEVEISKLQVYKQDFSSGSASNVYFINGTRTSYVSPYSATTVDAADLTLPNWVTLVEKNGQTFLKVNHTMNTNLNDSDVDVSPYHFVVTLHLKDAGTDTKFDRTVHITQYPPIYVNTIYTSANNTTFLYGTAWSSGQTSVSNDRGTLGSIGGSGGSLAYYKTVITTTTLASLDTEPFTNLGVGEPRIGDPRVRLADSYPTNPFVSSQVWSASDFTGTDDDDIYYAGLDKTNFIAPQIMLASGYGANRATGNWLSNAQRCASYQEDGYPAGRWRLPTEAEILFISKLAKELELIPDPFASTGYWANSGRAYYSSGGSYIFGDTSGSSRSVRCVYDLWYWGDDKLSDATQWGGFQTDYINE